VAKNFAATKHIVIDCSCASCRCDTDGDKLGIISTPLTSLQRIIALKYNVIDGAIIARFRWNPKSLPVCQKNFSREQYHCIKLLPFFS